MIEAALLLSAVLLALGLLGLLARRNLLFMLMSVEVLLNAAALAFVAGGARWGRADGQVMFLLLLAVAAAEAAVGLAILQQARRILGTVDADAVGRTGGTEGPGEGSAGAPRGRYASGGPPPAREAT